MIVTQEILFDFFSKMSETLASDGYPILDDLRHEFPNIPWYQEIIQERIEDQELMELVNPEDS